MTHFYPNDKFIPLIQSIMTETGLDVVYEAGCGSFENAPHYCKAGIKFMGCDPYMHDPASGLPVFPLPVHQVKAVRDKPMLIVICRPDHGGWCDGVAGYMNEGSRFLYVGLPENVDRDLCRIKSMFHYDGKYGEDGENAWLIPPQEIDLDWEREFDAIENMLST